MTATKTLDRSPSSRIDWRSWVIAARPKTLTAAIAPIFSASALVFAAGFTPNFLVIFLCLLCALLLQLATNFINDGADFESGADTSERLGPMRAAQAGLLSPKQLYSAAYLCLMITFCIGLYLSWIGGWPIFMAGVFSIIFAALYTKGPFPLAYNGLGDAFVLVFFGLIAVNGVFFLQTMTLSLHSIVLSLSIGLLATLIIIVNNTRDIETDIKVGKWTLSALIGEKASRHYFTCVAALAFLLGTFCVFSLSGSRFYFLLPFHVVWLILSISVVRKFYAAKSGIDFNNCLQGTAKHLLLTSLLAVASLILIGLDHA